MPSRRAQDGRFRVCLVGEIDGDQRPTLAVDILFHKIGAIGFGRPPAEQREESDDAYGQSGDHDPLMWAEQRVQQPGASDDRRRQFTHPHELDRCQPAGAERGGQGQTR